MTRIRGAVAVHAALVESCNVREIAMHCERQLEQLEKIRCANYRKLRKWAKKHGVKARFFDDFEDPTFLW